MCSKNVKSFYPYLVERKNIGFLRLSSSPLRFQEQQGETSGLFKHDCAMVCLLVTKLGLWHLCVIHFETSSIFTKYIKHCKILVDKVICKLKLPNYVFYKKCGPKLIFFNNFFFFKKFGLFLT